MFLISMLEQTQSHRWRNPPGGVLEEGAEEGLSHCIKAPVILAHRVQHLPRSKGCRAAVGVRNEAQTGHPFKPGWTVLNHTCIGLRHTDTHMPSQSPYTGRQTQYEEHWSLWFSLTDIDKLSFCLPLWPAHTQTIPITKLRFRLQTAVDLSRACVHGGILQISLN